MTHASRAAALLVAAIAILFTGLPASAAAPTFPPLSGRVVDGAEILSPAVEAELTAKLQALETATGRQLVVATLPSLQGYEIEEYGYQLGRAWGIGSADKDDGAVFIVAPNERDVRIEVGYGLEGVLTDALSSVILQNRVLPAFRDGDMPGGIVAGTDAIIEQLSLDQAAAEERVQAATAQAQGGGAIDTEAVIFVVLVVLWVIMSLMRGRGRRRSRFGWVAPLIIAGASRRSGGDWGGGSFGGGGGFSGGGGSFGGGGASGKW